MLADRVVVESRKATETEGVRWEAGPDSEIELSSCAKSEAGTCVTLFLKPSHHRLAFGARAPRGDRQGIRRFSSRSDPFESRARLASISSTRRGLIRRPTGRRSSWNWRVISPRRRWMWSRFVDEKYRPLPGRFMSRPAARLGSPAKRSSPSRSGGW